MSNFWLKVGMLIAFLMFVSATVYLELRVVAEDVVTSAKIHRSMP